MVQEEKLDRLKERSEEDGEGIGFSAYDFDQVTPSLECADW